jgi:hypothetical protein
MASFGTNRGKRRKFPTTPLRGKNWIFELMASASAHTYGPRNGHSNLRNKETLSPRAEKEIFSGGKKGDKYIYAIAAGSRRKWNPQPGDGDFRVRVPPLGASAADLFDAADIKVAVEKVYCDKRAPLFFLQACAPCFC